MRIELLSPSSARVREQDIDMVRRLSHLSHQVFHALELRAVGGY